MNKSILYELLNRFSQKEMNEFEEFVHSPFFNKNQSVTLLFDYLRKLYPSFNSDAIKKETIYSSIFPGAEYNDGFMRTLMFNLTDLAERFLAYKGFCSSPLAKDRFLLHELNEKDCEKLIERKIKEILKKLNKILIQNSDYYFYRVMIEYEAFYFLNSKYIDKIEKVINRPEIEDMYDNITNLFFIHAIKHYVFYLNRHNLYHIDFKPVLFENIFKFTDPKYLHKNPVVSLYYNILMLYLKEDDITNYYNAKQKVAESEYIITKRELMWVYTNLQEYCNKMISKGRQGFLRELFSIHKIKIEKNIYAWREMPAKFYFGVVNTALKLKEYDWALNFIEKYKCELSSKVQNNVYYNSLALYEFSKKNFELSLELISKVKYIEIYQKTDVRCLVAKLYYELEMDEMLISHIDAFRHFLMHDKLFSQEKKEYYSNFVKTVNNLFMLRNKCNKEGVYLLAEKLSTVTDVFEKEWLLEKIEELTN